MDLRISGPSLFAELDGAPYRAMSHLAITLSLFPVYCILFGAGSPNGADSILFSIERSLSSASPAKLCRRPTIRHVFCPLYIVPP